MPDALERDITHGSKDSVHCRRATRHAAHRRAVRRLRHQPQDRLQVDRSLSEGRSRGPARSLATTERHALTAQRPSSCSAILEARHRHPDLGREEAAEDSARASTRRWPWPQRSTVCEILKRNGLVTKKRRRRAIGHPGKPTTIVTAPNDLWCADLQRATSKQATAATAIRSPSTDDFSRYLLACQALLDHRGATAPNPCLRGCSESSACLRRIRTDNGVPFATNTLARLSRLSAWWVRSGRDAGVHRAGQAAAERPSRAHASRRSRHEATRPPRAALAVAAAALQHASAASSTTSGRTKRSSSETRRRRSTSASPRPMPEQAAAARVPGSLRSALCQRQRRHPLDTRRGSASPPPAPASTSGSTRSMTGSGTCTSERSSSGGLLERHMRIEDAYGTAETTQPVSKKCYPCLRTKLSPISPAAHARSVRAAYQFRSAQVQPWHDDIRLRWRDRKGRIPREPSADWN